MRPKMVNLLSKWLLSAARRLARTSVALLCLTALLVSCGGTDASDNARRRPYAATVSDEVVEDLDPFFVIAFGAAPGRMFIGQPLDAAAGGASVRQIVRTFTTKTQFVDQYPSG